MKKSRFSKNHLSALWTNFWVFSSRNARIRRTLAAKLEISQNFDGNRWKFLSQKSEKCEKCKNFEFFFYSENKYFDAGSKISVPRGQYWKKNVKNRQLPSLKHLKNVKKFQNFCIVWRCIKKMACLIFWITHHGPRWPISAEKRRLAPFFDRNWPPGPMMGEPKNQACETRQTMQNTIPSVHPFKFDHYVADYITFH